MEDILKKRMTMERNVSSKSDILCLCGHSVYDQNDLL